MPIQKKIMSDVVTENNGSVRSDLLDNETTRPKFLSRKRADEYGEIGSSQTSRKNRKLFWWVLGGIAVVIILFFVVGSFARATIVVTPKSEEVELDDEMTFYRSGDSAVSPSFQTIEIRDEVSQELSSTGTKHIERKASGKILVFNEYGAESIKLRATTRFQAPNGKIFKTPVAITVPGTKVENGKTVPGSVEVEVLADEPGASYNVGLVDFTIPGLSGDPSYTKVYGRAKTTIEGGYSGEVPVVSEADKKKAEGELESQLEKKLTEKLTAETPSGYVLIPNIEQFEIGDIEANYDAQGQNSGSGSAIFRKKGTLVGVIVGETELAKTIAKLRVSGYKDEEVYLSNIESLTFTAKDSKFDPSKSPTLILKVNGNATLIWKYSPDDLKVALAGEKKSDYEAIFSQFPMIKNAEIKISPFWKLKFPSNTEKITIKD